MSVLAATRPPRARPATGRRARAYVAFARAGMRQELATIPALLARASFLAAILFVFSRLWDRVLANATAIDLGSGELLWYLAVTEWIVLSFPYLHWEIETDLRSGELVARLPQPVSYAGARVAEGAGQAVVRMAVIGAVAAALASVFAGGLPAEPAGIAVAAPLGAIGIAFGLLCTASIGMGAVWLQDASPLFWIWQKLVFVLGGLMLPLAIYPDTFRAIAEWTPFGAMLNGPARQVFALDGADALLVAGQLVLWNALAALGVAWLWRRAQRALDAHGG